jgi:transposase
MGTVQLSSSQRRQLRVQLGETEDAGYYRRLLALLELDRGTSATEVADRLGVARQSVYNWARLFAADPRPAALRDRYGGGRPSVWTDSLQELLQAALGQHPDAFGLTGMNWTVPLLREYLHRQGDRWVSDDTIRRELDRLGYVWKRYRYVLPPDPQREKKKPDPAAAGGVAAG